jgi:type IV pilus assembly protein PilA
MTLEKRNQVLQNNNQKQGGNMNKVKNSQSGFSLVELMIVVAIIGILSSIAVPQFQKFIFKARQTEAKTGLSSLYTAEKAFYGEWSQYDERFEVIGYMPEGKYFYNIGFTDATMTSSNYEASSPYTGTANGNSLAYCSVNPTKCSNMASASSATSNGIIDNAGLHFAATAQAVSLNPDGGNDEWNINESKVISNVAFSGSF